MPKKTKTVRGGIDREKVKEEIQPIEEKAKDRHEVFTLTAKDKLEAEPTVELLKVNEDWRSSRGNDLHEDTEVPRQMLQMMVDSLDSSIKNLECDLQRADHQSAHLWRVHLQHIEDLRAQQDKRLMFVQQQWEGSLQHLNSRFLSQREQTLTKSGQRLAELKDVTLDVEKQHKIVINEIHKVNRDIITASECAYEDVEVNLRDADEDILLENQGAEINFRRESEEFNELREKNQPFIQQMDKDTKRVERLQDLVFQMREHYNTSMSEYQSREQDLTDNQNQVKQKTQKLREQMTRSQKEARKQLTTLCQQGDKAVQKLQAVIAKGERVLRVSEICQKLESKLETTSLPLFSAEEHRPETTELEIEEPKTRVSELLELQRLTQSLNIAVQQREALKKHKQDLSRENQRLRLLLHQRLDAMTHTRDQASLIVTPAPTVAPMGTNRRNTVINVVHARHTT